MEQFVITDGKRFIRKNISNKYEFTFNLALADIYSCSTANQILKNCLSKSMSIGLGVAKVVNGEIGTIAIPQGNVRKKSTNEDKAKTSSEKADDVKSVSIQYDNLFNASVQDWSDQVSTVKDLRSKAFKRQKQLVELQQQIEGYKCDVLHYIEFNKLNCRDGYKSYAILREILQMRRKIKDELEVVGYVLEQYSEEIEKALNTLHARIEGKNNRKYASRGFDALFDGGIGSEMTNEQFNELVLKCTYG